MIKKSHISNIKPISVCGALDIRAIDLRKKIIYMLLKAGRGHLASALSVIDIVRVLYDDVMNFMPSNPRWVSRDRFILSKGHACMAQYVLLAEKGFFAESELENFCKAGSFLGGHPEYPHIPGVEASTGSLGHGLSIGIGMAIAAKIDATDARVFVIVGDGECNEGSIWEAALTAAKHKLDNLILIVDYNKFQSYGSTSEVLELEPLVDKWQAFGWQCAEVNGHNIEDLQAIFKSLPLNASKPNAIICHTIKGAGISSVENNLSWHHKSGLKDSEAQALIKEMGA